MEGTVAGRLAGWDIHGFRTMEDLDVGKIMEEAKARWLRPNEIHAILCNYKCFNVSVKPVNLPKSGTIVLFDRKMLRNFRKDGHSWKKKKDGKTVKEAHEHLKVGNEEKIHVYYAHGEDNSTFVRRCYWLLDKMLEHIVLVHYRETQELQGSPNTPASSNSSLAPSGLSASWLWSEETDSGADPVCYTAEKSQSIDDLGDSMTLKDHERRLHEINTLDWDELLEPNDLNKLSTPDGGKTSDFGQQNQYQANGLTSNGNIPSANKLSIEYTLVNHCFQRIEGKDGFHTQDSFGRWMNYIISDSPGSVDDPIMGSSIPSGHELSTSPGTDQLPSFPGQIFYITDVSPAWGFSNEETKILIAGFFSESHQHFAKSNLYCVCGDACSPVEIVQSVVFRCLISPHAPGLTNLYLSFDGQNPISQVLTFEYRSPLTHNWMISAEDKSTWEEFRVQMRLFHLIFSTSKTIDILSDKVSLNTLKEAKNFTRKTSHIVNGWAYMTKSIENSKISVQQAKDNMFELALKIRLYEWLLERAIEGSKTSEHDDQGQGVIHLCAMLDYTWAVCPFAWSGFSLDYRDKFGWTALHWAAYCGREKMVAALLSAGAKPNLVTDPNFQNPGGCTAADLAFQKGYDGLAAYLAEKALVDHFKDMKIAGNASGSLQTSAPNTVNLEYIDEEEIYLKDTLTAYRTAADAAARIQAAFREHSFKMRAKEVQSSNPENEARNIIAAMKIQHAFRNYGARKKMTAAAQIQHRFRTWKTRRQFLNMRRQAVKIQAVFRGFQVRRQYRKVCWSVGVVEKAILRWRLKRRGFRGLKIPNVEAVKEQDHGSVVDEDFFRASRKQAEERVERSIVRVQAMFRSKRAQHEYRRMKLACDQARLEYETLVSSDTDIK
ncbi:calmodulin-binding transcription activator 5-like isoform X2 [Diospyros lotus]|uniref:calmodulin-binding transcription activator 5-like isoform X2 n=1 Tax=Diospyros lotus TaxID=55363 RepID=UPI00225900BC|nr:calmodulin-binding transcription activator 5-like isoform X2 [Diospyros lotus]